MNSAIVERDEPVVSSPRAWTTLAGSALGTLVEVRVHAGPDDAGALAELFSPLLTLAPTTAPPGRAVLGLTVDRRADGWGLVDEAVTDLHVTVDDVAEAALAVINSRIVEAAQRHWVVLHAAGVVVDGRTVLLVAPSGSGKSTLAAGLVGAGADYLGDEAAAISPDDLSLHAYRKPLALKAGSLTAVRRAAATGARPDRRLLDPSRMGVRVPETAAPPSLLVLPGFRTGATGTATVVPPAEAVLAIAQSTFGFAEHGERDLAVLARLVRQAPVVALSYRDLEWAVRAVQDLAGSTVEVA